MGSTQISPALRGSSYYDPQEDEAACKRLWAAVLLLTLEDERYWKSYLSRHPGLTLKGVGSRKVGRSIKKRLQQIAEFPPKDFARSRWSRDVCSVVKLSHTAFREMIESA